MSIFVCSAFVMTALFAVLSNSDMLSPGKFYLVSFLLFYVGAFNDPQNVELWSLIFLVLIAGIASICFESGRRMTPTSWVPKKSAAPEHGRSIAIYVWILSLPAIVAQIYIIRFFNGIEGYINMIGNRVIEFRGLGWAKTLIATIVVFNLCYFAVGLTRRRGMWWWLVYVAHLLLVLGMGVLSGSRGSIFTIFALQVFVYHYIRRPVKLIYAVPAGALLIVCAMLFGVLREGLKLDNGELATGLDNTGGIWSAAIFNYGVQPLQLLLRSDELHLADGSTFLSVATNVVPRNWWPEKPDTGGVFFTKQYTDNAWEGASNLTPTYLGEGIMNFGWLAGVGFFLVTSLPLSYWLAAYYRSILRRLRTPPTTTVAIDLVMYVFVMWAVVALMAGEVTNVIQTLVMTQLIPAFAVRKWMAAKPFFPVHAHAH